MTFVEEVKIKLKYMSTKRDPRLKAFVKVDKLGQVVPGTLIIRYRKPEGGRGFYWFEIPADICCTVPTSNFEFTLNGDGEAEFFITSNGDFLVNTDNSQAGNFNPGTGETVVITVTGEGPTKTLLVVDDTTGVVLSNQVGTTGDLTYTYVTPAAHAFTVIAMSGPTTTTTTTTTTTSTTTTSTTSTTTSTTSSTTTTTTTP